MEREIAYKSMKNADGLFDFKYISALKLKFLGIGVLSLLILVLSSINFTLALIPGILVIYLAETHSGITLDMGKRKYKDYQSVFGYKSGEWKSFENYPIITIKMITGVRKYKSGDGYIETDIRDERRRFDVLLADRDHRRTIFLKSFEQEEKAIDFARSLEFESDLIFQLFNPKISSATRARKRKSRYR